MNKQRILTYTAMLLAAKLLLTTAMATETAWSGGSGDWFDAAKWTNGVPAAGVDVVIPTGASINLTNATPTLGKVTMNGGTLTFANWSTYLAATDVVVKSGNITAVGSFTGSAMSNRVHIVCHDFHLQNGATINVSGKGYSGGANTAQQGHGPGKGLLTSSGTYYGGGAGHGGLGGRGENGLGGAVYGDPAYPKFAGSGGGGKGGAGGGAVWLEATGHVIIDGTINANATGVSQYAGGGSGGSILIECNTFGGNFTGLLTANGGQGGSGNQAGGGGAGGRIALHYDSEAQKGIATPRTRFSVAKGIRTYNRAFGEDGYIGTLYLPDALLLTPVPDNMRDVKIIGVSQWQTDYLTVTNNLIWFGSDNFKLNVTGDVTCRGSGSLGFWSMCEVTIGGDLSVTNGGALHVFAGYPAGGTSRYGATIDIAGTLRVGAGSWVYPAFVPETGASLRLPRVTNTAAAASLFKAATLEIAAGGGFNANGWGFSGGNDNSASGVGHGPGGGKATGHYGGGGGHGGSGGTGQSGGGGIAYDNPYAPVQPGSGGGGSAGSGGGAMALEIDGTAAIGGSLVANADSTQAQYGGGGAGGAISLLCGKLLLQPTAVITANGGKPGTLTNGTGGGGAGGRIAVVVGASPSQWAELQSGTLPEDMVLYSDHAPRKAQKKADGATGKAAERHGEAGTLNFICNASDIFLGITGFPEDVGSPQPQEYGYFPYTTQGLLITNTIEPLVPISEASAWVPLYWELFDGANQLVDRGAAGRTEAVFNLDEALELHWHWTNIYRLVVSSSAEEQGSVNETVVNGWYTNLVSVANITATSEDGYEFAYWFGDVDLVDQHQNPLTVTMDRPREIAAVFISTAGETKVWSGTGIWEDGAKWTPSGAPGKYDTAIISAGNVTFGEAARQVKNLTVANGATMTFVNWLSPLTANNVTVESGGKITLGAAFNNAGPSNRVNIACTQFTLESGATIDVNGKGYAGGTSETTPGNGPGYGRSTGHYGGGGYGGAGGKGYSGSGGPACGDAAAPLFPGSGGGGETAGGHGGGAILIQASGRAVLDGLLTANGNNSGSYGGAGSGGGIMITCHDFIGGGTLRANGGNTSFTSNGSGGGGGGGRIALNYNTTAQALLPRQEIAFQTKGGTHGATAGPGEVGTTWLPDTGLLTSGLECFNDTVIHGVTSWDISGLSLNNKVLGFGEVGLGLNASGDTTIKGGSRFMLPGLATMQINGDLKVEGGSTLVVEGGVTNELTGSNGAQINISGDMSVDNSWVQPVMSQTSLSTVPVTFALRNLNITTNAGFNAIGRGYRGGRTTSEWGYGPQPGRCSGGGYYGGGGGHGGAGGSGSAGVGGGSYGSLNAPVTAGSGGGGNDAGDGGGVIKIDARGNITLNGTLDASGSNSPQHGGGGAGGSIFVRCHKLLGSTTAKILATGGNAGETTNKNGGGGGGGRIAIWQGKVTQEAYDLLIQGEYPKLSRVATEHPLFFGTISAAKGLNPTYPARDGAPGTALFIDLLPPPGTLLLLR